MGRLGGAGTSANSSGRRGLWLRRGRVAAPCMQLCWPCAPAHAVQCFVVYVEVQQRPYCFRVVRLSSPVQCRAPCPVLCTHATRADTHQPLPGSPRHCCERTHTGLQGAVSPHRLVDVEIQGALDGLDDVVVITPAYRTGDSGWQPQCKGLPGHRGCRQAHGAGLGTGMARRVQVLSGSRYFLNNCSIHTVAHLSAASMKFRGGVSSSRSYTANLPDVSACTE